MFLFVLPGTPAVLATDEQEQEQEQEHEEEQEEDAPLCNYFSTKRCNADRFCFRLCSYRNRSQCRIALRGTKHKQPSDLGLHIRNWTRCLEQHALSLRLQQEHGSADLGVGKKPHDPLSHVVCDSSRRTKRQKSHATHHHAEYNVRRTELCQKKERHDQVNDLRRQT